VVGETVEKSCLVADSLLLVRVGNRKLLVLACLRSIQGVEDDVCNTLIEMDSHRIRSVAAAVVDCPNDPR
jgi:hypothetical protein